MNKIIFGGFYGGTDVFSSPNDFTILIKCLLDKGTFNGYKMLKEETIEEMSKPDLVVMMICGIEMTILNMLWEKIRG